MKINRLLSALYYTGLILILTGTVMQITTNTASFQLFTAGLLPVFGIRLYNLIVSAPQNRRINATLLVSALALTATAAAIYYQRSYWIIFIAIAALLDGYTSFRRVK